MHFFPKDVNMANEQIDCTEIIKKLDDLCHEMKQPIQLINSIIDVMDANVKNRQDNPIMKNIEELRNGCELLDSAFNDIYKIVKKILKQLSK
jgi:hypothetical protein